MRHRGWIATAVAAVLTGVAVSGFAINRHALAVKPPAVTGAVTLQVARNTDPRAKQFLDDVHRGEYTWLAMPSTFVEGTIHWHLPRRLDTDDCQVAFHVLPEAAGRLGTTSTNATGEVSMGEDYLQDQAFHQPNGTIFYGLLPSGTDGTATFVVAYTDESKVVFGEAAAHASAVVECANHDGLFNQTRSVVGPVTNLPVSVTS